jgi:hypothetical protein
VLLVRRAGTQSCFGKDQREDDWGWQPCEVEGCKNQTCDNCEYKTSACSYCGFEYCTAKHGEARPNEVSLL